MVAPTPAYFDVSNDCHHHQRDPDFKGILFAFLGYCKIARLTVISMKSATNVVLLFGFVLNQLWSFMSN